MEPEQVRNIMDSMIRKLYDMELEELSDNCFYLYVSKVSFVRKKYKQNNPIKEKIKKLRCI